MTLTHIKTDQANEDITSAMGIANLTATKDTRIMIDVSLDGVAGGGDYQMFVTRQIGGAGSHYVILPKTTMTAEAGETAISGQSGWISVRTGDVLAVFAKGLAGDDEISSTVRWFEEAPVTLASTQPAITWAQQKIVADVAGEGALHIVNGDMDEETSDGYGVMAFGNIGQRNWGTQTGQSNQGVTSGQYNEGWNGAGQYNKGVTSGQYNKGQYGQHNYSNYSNGFAQFNEHGSIQRRVMGYAPELALQATLREIKGNGWTTETLKAIKDAIDAIEGGGSGGATAQDVWEYTNRTLTESPTDVSGLATSAELAELETLLEGLTEQERYLIIIAAAVAGKLSRVGNTLTFRDIDDTKNAITAQVDEQGQRNSVEYDV